VISKDDQIAVAVNRGANTISVFDLALGATPVPSATRRSLLTLTTTAPEPWTAIIGNDDDTAFVVLRHDRQVIRVSGLRTTPAIDPARADTGSEPSGIAISPSGRWLYVTNWAEGTVTVVRTKDMSIKSTIDLNGALAGSHLLGDNVLARPGLAHPMAVAVTNNGSGIDTSESIYVTEFFSMPRSVGVPIDDSAFDLNRQGIVYHIHADTEAVDPPITISPIADTGFVDSNGATTGCFPNQLRAATQLGNRLYVTAVCESPRGPVGPVVDAMGNVNPANFKTQVHAAVFVVDTTTNTERAAEAILLTQKFQALFDASATPDDGANRRMPLIPSDIAFVPSKPVGYVSAYGSDAVFRFAYNGDGSLKEVGSSTQKFIDLAPTGIPAGKLPIGIAIANVAMSRAVVLNENTRNLSILSFATQTSVATIESSPLPTPGSLPDQINNGRRFFVTGTGRWSFKGQAWNSCEACHPQGLSDNVTWFFARGPRQTISLDATFDKVSGEQRLLNWTAIFDEIQDFELNTRGNSGGVGAIVYAVSTPPSIADRIIFDGTTPLPGQQASATLENGLNGSTKSLMPGGPNTPVSAIGNFNDIEAYLRTIRPPRALVTLSPSDVSAGATLFSQNNCAGCHGTRMWTLSRVFYTPSDTNNAPMTGALINSSYTVDLNFPPALNPASAGTGRTAPLRFNGTNPGANDQINCALRAVGSFPMILDTGANGIAISGVRVREVRQDMATPAQGATGFNPPSLLGMSVGAPFFHAGNARTLEEVFDPTFEPHYTAFSSNFLIGSDRATQIRQLAAYLLAIDGDSPPVAPPLRATLGFDPQTCPTTFP
jgi:hypothetical protein